MSATNKAGGVALTPDMRAILDLADDEARRARLAALFPRMALADAEAIVTACHCPDRGRGERAFEAALDKLGARAIRRAA